MVPSPENDNAPKAPDKNDKAKRDTTNSQSQELEANVYTTESKEASVLVLDDSELKALLDEAINYKTPKDRVGKSKLFINLLDKAEEDDRKARATSASGSESVRYYNTTATHRTRRKRESNSVSENIAHGGSLNNLAKEELYTVTSQLHRPSKTVSTRQHQGGSLPCNVNTGLSSSYDKQFFEEAIAVRKTEMKKSGFIPMDTMESESLLEHDSLDYNEQQSEDTQSRIPRAQLQPAKYTSRLNFEIKGGNGTNVDDSLTVSALEKCTEKVIDNDVSYKTTESIATTALHPVVPISVPHQLMQPGWPFLKKSVEDKKVDENGNALGQSNVDTKKIKKKKAQTDKNVVVLNAKDVEGHRSDIINDLDKLVEYIGGNSEQAGVKSKTTIHKSKLKSNFPTEDRKKQRTSKGKVEKLQKSNSMEEISISKLNDFSFGRQGSDSNKIPLRGTKSNADRPRECRSWGNCESLPLHVSAENLENSDFRVVTKKKKSKKRRNSLSGRRQTYNRDSQDDEFNRVAFQEPRRKSACSAPHSDKSNDSSDVDSVHSLPIGNIDSEHLSDVNLNLPVSYADMAKNCNSLDRPKWNRPPSERKSRAKDNFNDEKFKISNELSVTPLMQSELTLGEQLDNKCDLDNNNKSGVTIESIGRCGVKVEVNKSNLRNNFKNVQRNSENVLPSGYIQNFNYRNERLPKQNSDPSSQVLPYNIPDVQTIEKMHFKQLMEQRNNASNFKPSNVEKIITNHVPSCGYNVNQYEGMLQREQQHKDTCGSAKVLDDVRRIVSQNSCDIDRTSSRPAVVILSGDNKEVSGITFGFDINEQLLSDDVCSNFTTRFFVPDTFRGQNHDKIVNFIGFAWEDIVSQADNSKIKFFNDHL